MRERGIGVHEGRCIAAGHRNFQCRREAAGIACMAWRHPFLSFDKGQVINTSMLNQIGMHIRSRFSKSKSSIHPYTESFLFSYRENKAVVSLRRNSFAYVMSDHS
ncbi:hypothetical protein BC829DRAFT_274218, partial [Chytridium lagenaria]